MMKHWDMIIGLVKCQCIDYGSVIKCVTLQQHEKGQTTRSSVYSISTSTYLLSGRNQSLANIGSKLGIWSWIEVDEF